MQLGIHRAVGLGWGAQLAFVVGYSVVTGAFFGLQAGLITIGLLGIVGIPFGGLAGLAIAPLVGFCFWRRFTPSSVVAVSVSVFIVTSYCGFVLGLPWEIAPFSIATMCAACICVRVCLPPVRETAPDGITCAGCGYSLIGNVSGRCPECGEVKIGSREDDGSTDRNRLDAQRRMRHRLNAVCVGIVCIVLLLAYGRSKLLWPDSVDGWIALLGNGEALIHERSIDALGSRGSTPFLRALKSDDPKIRRNAAKGLIRYGDAEDLSGLLVAIHDTDVHTRNWSARAIVRIADRPIKEQIMELYRAADGSSRHILGDLLRQLGIDPSTVAVETSLP